MIIEEKNRSGEVETVEAILDGFVEGFFRLMLEHHQRQVVVTDLTLTQAQALRLLRVSGQPTSRLATALGISAPAVTQLTDRLVRKRLIERRIAEGDRRWVHIELTDKGRVVIDGLRRRRNDVFSEALARLSEADRARAIEVLAKLTAVIAAAEPGFTEPSRRVPRPRTERRTAIESPQASKDVDLQKVDERPVSRPAKRMKIEWD
jgi:DNA-binding MarR family transcriptional regulator